MNAAQGIFWIAAAGIVYVYAGYPLLLLMWRKLAPRHVMKEYQEPSVSLVIAMHNERRNAESKMQNCLALDYPSDKLQVVVALDGPTDGTETVVQPYAERGVDVVHLPIHQGKAAVLNRAMLVAKGEIVVFSDARQELDKSAVRELVANFSDESVGAVSGELILLDADGKVAGDAIGAYWRYEKCLRALESQTHSVVGVTGAIYAIRRSLFKPILAGTILDDVAIPMKIVLAGKRVVFDPAARAYDTVSASAEVEYPRKVRTLTGNYQFLAQTPELLTPARNPVFLQLVSHKVGRLLVPYLLMALLISNFFLLEDFYRIALAAQLSFYLLAAAGAVASSTRRRSRASLEYSSGTEDV